MDCSKCDGVDCQIKDWCYRFTAPITPEWQSWMDPQPRGYECDHFYPNGKELTFEQERVSD